MRKTIGDSSMCWKCGANGSSDPLDIHEIFFGSGNRKLSIEDGFCVALCHNSCHIFGPEAVHQNRVEDLKLKRQGQRYAMAKGWTMEDFIRRYGRNYLDEHGLDIEMEEDEIC